MRLENLLDIDPRLYLESVGRTAADYTFKGVRVSVVGVVEQGIGSRGQTHGTPRQFLKEVPADAEVVVNYKETYLVAQGLQPGSFGVNPHTPYQGVITGLALIPRFK